MQDVLSFASQLSAAVIHEGDLAVDATVGNGHDTLHLAHAVGPSGTVVGFDIQQEAINNTRKRLQRAGVSERVRLVCRSHEHIQEELGTGGNVAAVMFNLGYLPGSDKSLITKPESTIEALGGALSSLRPGGIITLVLYTGHPGGAEEAERVRTWATSLNQESYRVLSYRFINQQNAPPALLAIQRLPGS